MALTFLTKNQFIESENAIAICGVYIREDAIHVGIALKEDEAKIIHFLNGERVPYENLELQDFDNYLFAPIIDFNNDLIPSLSALCEIISLDPLVNKLQFSRNNIIYDGGKFNLMSGVFQINSMIENIVNCGIFVTALLKTYDYNLLDWNTWPNSRPQSISRYLDIWLSSNISDADREKYYNTSKEIRGKHVIVSPLTQSKPSVYLEAEDLANNLIKELSEC